MKSATRHTDRRGDRGVRDTGSSIRSSRRRHPASELSGQRSVRPRSDPRQPDFEEYGSTPPPSRFNSNSRMRFRSAMRRSDQAPGNTRGPRCTRERFRRSVREARVFGGDGGTKRFNVGVERLSTGRSEPNPGSGFPVDASLLNAHNFLSLQCGQILRQPDRGEKSLLQSLPRMRLRGHQRLSVRG